MLPAQLVEEVEQLRSEGWSIDLIEAEGYANLVFHDYPLRKGWSKSATELLLKFPMSYPNGQPDMFWTEAGLTLADGRVGQGMESIETALEKQRRRFSWHPQKWNPSSDNLRTYLEFVNSRLAKVQ